MAKQYLIDIQVEPNKQHLPLKIAQNFTVQWADLGYFGRTNVPIGIYVKEKHSTLHKRVSSVKVGSIAEYFTLNSTQFSRATFDIFSCIN